MYHETNPADDRSKLVHEVCFLDVNNPKAKKNSRVNSIHHQVVINPPENAIVIAWHSKKKVFIPYEIGDHIEALYYPEINCASVQFHPEEIMDIDEISDMLIRKLLENKE
jgi:gamma-glutamyl-gamma-aminobutyrate hydrolase PuuD